MASRHLPSDSFFLRQALHNKFSRKWMELIVEHGHLWENEVNAVRAEFRRLKAAYGK